MMPVEDIGVAGIEAEYKLAPFVEYHDTAFEDEYTDAVTEGFPVQGFALTEDNLDEFTFYHKRIFITQLSQALVS